MILLLENAEAWSLMLLASAIAIDNAEISDEGKEEIRRWRSDRPENSEAVAKLTSDLNSAINSHIDAKFMRRIKQTGGRADTVRK